MTESVEAYANEFPDEISDAIDGMGGTTERAIFVLLFDDGPLAFTELQDQLSGEDDELHQTTLSNSLSNLQKGGLVEKRVKDADPKSRFSSYYNVTEYGNRFAKALFDTLGIAHGEKGRSQSIIQVRGDQSLYDASMEVQNEMVKTLK